MIQYLTSFFSKVKTTSLFLLCLSLLGLSAGESSADQEQGRLIYMDLEDGMVVIKSFPSLAPVHVERIEELVKQGFYDGVVFHRVIEGFMAQTGDPTGTGSGGSGKNLPAEFSDKPHKRGIVSMARASNPNSADSQFFIMFADAPYLDGQYTVWGEVVEGMQFVDKIKKGSSANNGIVNNPDKIIRMYMKDTEGQ